MPAFLIFIFLFGACTQSPAPHSDQTVVSVNGNNYSSHEFAEDLTTELKTHDALAAKDPTNLKRAKEHVIRDFIVSTLLMELLKEKKAEATPEEIETEFNKVRKTYPNDLAFRGALSAQGLTLDGWKRKLARTVNQQKAFNFILPDSDELNSQLEKEAKKQFDAEPSRFKEPETITIKHIVLQKEDEAERIRKSIKEGANFEEVAKKYSVGPEGKTGGILKGIRRGDFEVFDRAFNMNVGALSDVLKSNYGFHIIKLIDKKKGGQRSFAQAKEILVRNLKAQKQGEAFQDWLKKRTEVAKVLRNEDLIENIQVITESRK